MNVQFLLLKCYWIKKRNSFHFIFEKSFLPNDNLLVFRIHLNVFPFTFPPLFRTYRFISFKSSEMKYYIQNDPFLMEKNSVSKSRIKML